MIDADALLENAKKYVYPSDMTTTIALGIAETWIKDAPAVDAAPVRHGVRYLGRTYDWYMAVSVCSLCGCEWMTEDDELDNYCPNCGAKMDGGGDDATD